MMIAENQLLSLPLKIWWFQLVCICLEWLRLLQSGIMANSVKIRTLKELLVASSWRITGLVSWSAPMALSD